MRKNSDENLSLGTPKTLHEAIVQGACIGRMRDIQQSLYFSIRDFLAQRFNTAMLSAPTTAEEGRLKELFEEIIRATPPG